MIEPPIGDPAGMRALAARLRDAASDVVGAADGLASRSDNMTLKGPAGDRFRDGMSEQRSRGRAVATRASDIAATLTRSAAEVEDAIAAYDRWLHSRIEDGP